jgi:hypothetical protein
MHRKAQAGTDYVVHLRPSGEAKIGSGPKVRGVLEKALAIGPVTYGGPAMGSSLSLSGSEILENVKDGQALHLTFDHPEKFAQAVGLIASLGLNISLSVSGPLEDVLGVAKRHNLTVAGYQFDLGQILSPGLPAGGLDAGDDGWLLELVSLCGHMRISPYLAKSLMAKIAAGTLSPAKAAARLGRPCRCGCFNLTAAEKILAKAAQKFA